MNEKIKKTTAIAFVFAIALSISSLTVAASGIDIQTTKAPIDPTKDPFTPLKEFPVPEDYQVRNSNEFAPASIIASSTVTFTGSVTVLWNESFPSGSGVYAIQARDLDGDKKDDLILVVYNWGTNTHTVIAKRGSDGSHLWEESVTGSAWIDVKVPGNNVSRKSPRYGDLDGDRLPDVVVTINNWDTNTRTVIAKKGIDGTHMWEKSVSGNVWVTAEFIDDLSRDRLADVLVTVNNWSTNEYTISVNKGSDGTAVWQESGSGNAWISGIGDLNGDRYVDLLLTVSNSPTSTYSVIAKKGNDGTNLWQASSSSNIWGVPIGDLDRDRRENTLVGTSDTVYAVGVPRR